MFSSLVKRRGRPQETEAISTLKQGTLAVRPPVVLPRRFKMESYAVQLQPLDKEYALIVQPSPVVGLPYESPDSALTVRLCKVTLHVYLPHHIVKHKVKMSIPFQMTLIQACRDCLDDLHACKEVAPPDYSPLLITLKLIQCDHFPYISLASNISVAAQGLSVY